MTGHGYSRLMDRILDVLPQACDHHLKAAYITEVFTSVLHHPVFNPEALEAEGVDLFKYVEDQYLEASFYIGCGHYYNSIKIDIPKVYGCMTQHSLSLELPATEINSVLV
ncbi:hypothetical protein C8R43DRAFT_1134170 [Mycena crocata]|nr:hypothetical protein C8R43DRAFT_1134170 [Mycena crocata]